MTQFANEVLAVTGGASGIGLATAELWVARGGRVVLLDFSAEQLAAASARLGERSRGVPTDVRATEQLAAAYSSIAEREGRLDTVVNCAGQSKPVPSATMSDADWLAVVEVHLNGTMRSCREAFELLRASEGAIVNLSSISASHGMPMRASYCAVKSGIEGLTRELAVEWAPARIRVNAVAPGYVRTALVENLIAQGFYAADTIIRRIPMGRMATPTEIAEAICFLASRRASFCTGAVLAIDGGMSVEGNWYE